MKRVVFLLILVCLSTAAGFSQNGKLPIKSNTSKPSPTQSPKEISDFNWRILINVVQSENWEKSQSLAKTYLSGISSENEKRQMARLRYIFLYASAGKIVKFSLAGKKTEEDKARGELEAAAKDFLNAEFFMPSRRIADDCQGRFNYICRAKQPENVLRVTTTDKSATAVFSFEYVSFNGDFSVAENVGRQAIISGILKKVEFNPQKSNLWIMRLFFENGSVSVVPDK